ncbi:KDO2-lipid IV(A) lauroyltransferase [Algoriphagus ornithinivorans]|uniref:KDO2-lipid IV(A) lauroyltransferase n=1 Tax=Algoriphagus ornithinivorans TaxID=226506 RepID=A0A1I5DSI6_9BACT|nr:lysophospholipid acyltransferase family protein [Algoriphagus ornithinivorans]SFO02193.1 KDO2-lipid IV(A) lauroyltransferase [Algoriphagus ornithinivorans]
MFFFRLLSRLPLPILYLLTDFLYLIARFVIRYRKKVIDENLMHAFPELSDRERKKVRNRFYRNFTDTFAETIKILTISEAEFRQRFAIVNQPDLDKPVQNEVSSLMMAGHIFNWEMGVVGTNLYSQVPVETVYLKVNNPFFNELMKKIRTRFGGYVTEKKEFRRGMLTLGKDPRIVLLGSDQRPPSSENRYQREFMNRPAVFFEGAEFLSKKMNLHVHYGKMTKVKRGHYRYEYIPLAQPPFEGHAPHSITDMFCEMLEQNIREQPDMYLWSHKRWKI